MQTNIFVGSKSMFFVKHKNMLTINLKDVIVMTVDDDSTKNEGEVIL